MKWISFILMITLLYGCDFAAKKAGKEFAKENAKSVIEKSMIKKAGKEVIEDGVENSLERLSKGRNALNVIVRGENITPEIHNLGRNAVKYSEGFNKFLLKTRRVAMRPYDQFPTMQQLISYNRSKLIIREQADANILKKNMFLAMDLKSAQISTAFGGNQAHHIIEGTDPAAEASRNILKKFGININAPENGILLPSDENSIYKGSQHLTSHTKEYSDYVLGKIKGVSSKDELIAKLQEVKHELYEGKLNIQGTNQIVNKNKLELLRK